MRLKTATCCAKAILKGVLRFSKLLVQERMSGVTTQLQWLSPLQQDSKHGAAILHHHPPLAKTRLRAYKRTAREGSPCSDLHPCDLHPCTGAAATPAGRDHQGSDEQRLPRTLLRANKEEK